MPQRAMRMLEQLMADLSRDADLALPGGLMRAIFLESAHRPLVRALLLSDAEVLGNLAKDETVAAAQREPAGNKDYLATPPRPAWRAHTPSPPRLPAGLRPALLRTADHAYLHGMTQALIVCIGTLAVGALLVLALLPRRAPVPADHPGEAAASEPPRV